MNASTLAIVCGCAPNKWRRKNTGAETKKNDQEGFKRCLQVREGSVLKKRPMRPSKDNPVWVNGMLRSAMRNLPDSLRQFFYSRLLGGNR